MPKVPRNYVAEILSLGKSNRQLAKDLHTTVKRINAYQTGMFKPPQSQYEKIRNIARREAYQAMRKSGVSPKVAKQFQRVSNPKTVSTGFEQWLDKWAKIFQRKWNKNHPDKDDSLHLSLDEVKDRLKQGIKNGKSKNEIENY